MSTEPVVYVLTYSSPMNYGGYETAVLGVFDSEASARQAMNPEWRDLKPSEAYGNEHMIIHYEIGDDYVSITPYRRNTRYWMSADQVT